MFMVMLLKGCLLELLKIEFFTQKFSENVYTYPQILTFELCSRQSVIMETRAKMLPAAP